MADKLEDLLRDWQNVYEFKVEYLDGVFKRDTASRDALSKVMGFDFKAVYRHSRAIKDDNNKWTPKNIDLDCETIYAVNPKGRVIRFTNSEWGGIEVVE